MMLRLVIHAPTAGALARGRRNLRNFVAAEPVAEVELVANGEAARAALAEPDPETDRFLVLCRNSLSASRLAPPDGIATVPVAVQHIARREAAGWSYFRA